MPDAEGYPTDEEIASIKSWPYSDPLGWFAHIKSCWWATDWGWREQAGKPGKEQTILTVSTGGWSGNEEIITAMQENYILWGMTWQEARRGGHYKFILEKARASPQDPSADTH